MYCVTKIHKQQLRFVSELTHQSTMQTVQAGLLLLDSPKLLNLLNACFLCSRIPDFTSIAFHLTKAASETRKAKGNDNK